MARTVANQGAIDDSLRHSIKKRHVDCLKVTYSINTCSTSDCALTYRDCTARISITNDRFFCSLGDCMVYVIKGCLGVGGGA